MVYPTPEAAAPERITRIIVTVAIWDQFSTIGANNIVRSKARVKFDVAATVVTG